MRNSEGCLSTPAHICSVRPEKDRKGESRQHGKDIEAVVCAGKKMDNLLLYGKMLNAATIVALYRVLYYHRKRSGK